MKNKLNLNNQGQLQQASANASGISVTTSSFETKIKRRLQEQSSSTQLAQQQANDNRVLVLQMMNTIRRAFNEVVAIDLGNRFYLDLEVNDLNGWPRLELCLIDNQIPNQISEKLTASVQTQSQNLLIEMRSSAGSALCNLEVPSQKNCDAGLLIKKCIRLFLDELEQYIMNPKMPDVAPLNSDDEKAETCAAVKELKETELFNDNLQIGNGNLLTAESSEKTSIKLDK